MHRLLFAACATPALTSTAWSNGALLSRLRQLSLAQPSEAAQALRSLDTNQDGRVGFDEVAAFARTKGLDYSSTLSEFASFDSNRDGSLTATELAGALGLPKPPPEEQAALLAPAAPSAPAAPAAPAAPVTRNLLGSAPRLAQASRAVPVTALAAAAPKATPSFTERAADLSQVAKDLALEISAEQEAEALDRKASDLRAKVAALASETAQRARAASSQAAQAKAEELFRNITAIEDKAEKAEVAAAVLRARASADVRAVGDLASIADSGLTASRGQ